MFTSQPTPGSWSRWSACLRPLYSNLRECVLCLDHSLPPAAGVTDPPVWGPRQDALLTSRRGHWCRWGLQTTKVQRSPLANKPRKIGPCQFSILKSLLIILSLLKQICFRISHYTTCMLSRGPTILHQNHIFSNHPFWKSYFFPSVILYIFLSLPPPPSPSPSSVLLYVLKYIAKILLFFPLIFFLFILIFTPLVLHQHK